jgi:hypothetical protein
MVHVVFFIAMLIAVGFEVLTFYFRGNGGTSEQCPTHPISIR